MIIKKKNIISLFMTVLFMMTTAFGMDSKMAQEIGKSQSVGVAAQQMNKHMLGQSMIDVIDPKTEKEKIDAVNEQLDSWALYRYDKYDSKKNELILKNLKQVIVPAVAAGGIHPDKILIHRRLSGGETSLFKAIIHNDLEFVNFLLKHGANANQIRHRPILIYAKSVAIAQKLLEYGAQETIKSHGIEGLFAQMMSSEKEAELTPWYISQGINVNEYHQGETALMHLVRTLWYTDAWQAYKAEQLMEGGALLELRCVGTEGWMRGLTVPQMLKKRAEIIKKEIREGEPDDEYEDEKYRIEKVRSSLIEASHRNRDKFISIKHELVEQLPDFPIKLLNLIRSFCIVFEKTYEELEAEPYAPSQEHASCGQELHATAAAGTVAQQDAIVDKSKDSKNNE